MFTTKVFCPELCGKQFVLIGESSGESEQKAKDAVNEHLEKEHS